MGAVDESVADSIVEVSGSSEGSSVHFGDSLSLREMAADTNSERCSEVGEVESVKSEEDPEMSAEHRLVQNLRQHLLIPDEAIASETDSLTGEHFLLTSERSDSLENKESRIPDNTCQIENVDDLGEVPVYDDNLVTTESISDLIERNFQVMLKRMQGIKEEPVEVEKGIPPAEVIEMVEKQIVCPPADENSRPVVLLRIKDLLFDPVNNKYFREISPDELP